MKRSFPNRMKDGIFSLLILFFSSSVLILHGYLAGHSRLLADDFCSVYYARRLGLLRSIWYWRQNWSGRYSAFAADWLFTAILGTNISALMVFLLLIWVGLTFAALYLFFKDTEFLKKHKFAPILMGVVILFALFTINPDVPQSFYWWNGMRSYAMPLIFLTLYYVIYKIWVDRLDAKWKLLSGGALSFLLLFISGGFSETFAIAQFFLMLFLLVYNYLFSSANTKKVSLLLFAFGLIGSIASLLVIITAPGNAIRQLQLPPHPTLIGLVTISVQGYFAYLSSVLLSPEKNASLLGSFLFFLYFGGYYDAQPEGLSKKILVLFAGSIVLSFVCIPPGVFGYSSPPPPRTMIIPFFMLVSFLSLAFFLLGTWLSQKASAPFHFHTAALMLGVVLIVFSSVFQVRSLYQQRNSYIDFAREWDTVDLQILEARADGEASVIVPARENWARLNILNDNPKFWVNICYSQYYGILVFGPNPDLFQP